MKSQIIEIAGIPAAGKTSILSNIKKEYGHLIERNELVLIDDFSMINPLQSAKDRPYFNLWNLNQIVNKLLEQRNSGKVIIIEKGLMDLNVWLEWHLSKNNLTKEEYEIIRDYTEYIEKLISNECLIILDVDTKTALSRRSDRGRIFNEQTLMELQKNYEKVKFDNLSPHKITLDTSSLSEVEVYNVLKKEIFYKLFENEKNKPK